MVDQGRPEGWLHETTSLAAEPTAATQPEGRRAARGEVYGGSGRGRVQNETQNGRTRQSQNGLGCFFGMLGLMCCAIVSGVLANAWRFGAFD
jgi:hypothetical protein